MEKSNKERIERIDKRAKEMAIKSKLPPRMEMHEKAKKEGFVIKPKPERVEFPFQPTASKKCPNFELQHRVFQKALEKHKKQKQPTVLKPFKFNESKQKPNIMDYMNDENIQQIELKTKKTKTGEIASLKKPSVNPQSTLKMTEMVNKRRQELEERRKQELERDKEEQIRKNRDKKVD